MSHVGSPEDIVPPTAEAVDRRTEAHFRLCLTALDSLVADATAEPASLAGTAAAAKSLANDLELATRLVR